MLHEKRKILGWGSENFAENVAVTRKSPYLCSVLIQQLIVLHFKNFNTTMKKLVFMFAAFAAISFASCGSKTEAPAEVQDTVDTLAADSVDTLAPDSVDTLAV